jgi:uncharacterized membrane protein YdjX (TVP38/TMEM64 family)
MSTKKFLITVVPLAVVLSLIFFAIIQFTGEQLGFLPYIFVGGTTLTNGENVILFIMTLGISIVVALVVAFLLYKLSNSRQKKNR